MEDLEPPTLSRLPLSLQSFEDLRKRNYIYVDKTQYIYMLVNQGKSYFLARPRRFGKSLLCNTLRAYFEGKKELFDGLKISHWEKNWTKYPIFYLDFADGDYSIKNALRDHFSTALKDYAKEYDIEINDTKLNLSELFGAIVKAIKKQTGLCTALIIDEYDVPMITSKHIDEDTKTYREFLSVLKSYNDCFEFVFITGFTRCSKILYYDGNPHLCDLTVDAKFSEVCGFTRQELTALKDDIQLFANEEKMSYDEMLTKLEKWYGGYLFHERGVKVSNPARLFFALQNKTIQNYWQSTDIAPYLMEHIKKSNSDIKTLKNGTDYPKDIPFSDENLVSLLYFYGYLTIKSYDDEYRLYSLGVPNYEIEKMLAS